MVAGSNPARGVLINFITTTRRVVVIFFESISGTIARLNS
ncbi:hypothetical protein SynMITS9220_02795 [Synechococcus sp. MIT S9220]|nr:hypothetical protein SynMITS9220_02795 [Synechococcus sp. MIT S9220]